MANVGTKDAEDRSSKLKVRLPITNEIGAGNFTLRLSEREAREHAASTVTRGKMKSSYWKLNYF